MSRSLYDKLYRRFGTTLSESEVVRRGKNLIDADRALLAASASPPCPQLKQTKVAIVGGGFAGVMAAWTLCHREKDIEVVLFEGGREVGGRVNSDDKFTNGRVIDFGAELVGANHPRMLDLTTQLGVALMMRTAESDYDRFQLDMKFRVDGKDIDRKTGKQINDEMDQVFFKLAKDAKLIKDPASPWNQPDLQKKFDEISVDDKLTKPPPVGLGLPRDKLLFRNLEMLLGNNLVVPLKKMNYLGLLCLVKAGRFGTDEDDKRDGEDRSYLGFWQQTEVYRCSDGNQAIAKRMVAKLSDRTQKFKFTLLPNTRVKAIRVDEMQRRPVTLEWESSPAADRRKPNPFDYVILATPPTVWADIPVITPEHPLKAFGVLQTGPAVKFFSNLKDRFWYAERAAPSGISSDIGMIWEGTDNQMLVGDQEIELSVFAGGLGKNGRILTESEFMEGLRKLYPGYAASNRGKKTKLVSWPDNKLIKTGYSNPKVGHMFTVAPQLQLPLNHGRMFLAGEHTQSDFFGFMEGALRSGQRVAEALMARVCRTSGGEV
jgi:monoamine oxidase